MCNIIFDPSGGEHNQGSRIEQCRVESGKYGVDRERFKGAKERGYRCTFIIARDRNGRVFHFH